MEQEYPIDFGGAEMAYGITSIFCFASVILLFVVLIMICYCKIFAKAGYPWAVPLLILIPFVGQLIAFILLLFLAFSEWPVLRQQRRFDHTPTITPPGSGPPRENFRGL